MPIHRIARAACVLLALAHAAAAQTPPMSKPQAAKILDDAGIDPVPDNYPTAIMNGDAQSVRALIALGVDPNPKTTCRSHRLNWRRCPARCQGSSRRR